MNFTQKKCDDLLSPIIIKFNPKCLLCGRKTQVAHHHVHKSKSLILRYNLDNLINLCHGCHFKLHHNESYWASVIVQKKGMKWFKKLDKQKNKLCVGKNKINYEKIYKGLIGYLDPLYKNPSI